MILRVAIPGPPVYQLFDYLPPPGIDPATIPLGVRLKVPFGQRRVVGFLAERTETSSVDPAHLRPAVALLDAQPLLPNDVLALIQWAYRYYHYPPGEVFAAALPVLLRQGKPPIVSPSPARWRITPAGRAALLDFPASRAPNQWQLLDYLARCPEGAEAEALRPLVNNSTETLRTLHRKGWVERFAAAEGDLSLPAFALPSLRPTLTATQAETVTAVTAALGCFQVFLLEGVTGSGKTEVYLRIIEAALARGHQALVLTPEIGLTPQLVARFRERLLEPLTVFHSGLSDIERLRAWWMARSGRTRVLVGTRSAVFAPLPTLGVFIVDEEHDLSFKQQEGFRYHARDLAIVRAQHLGIPIVLGSATPSLESYYNVQRGRYRRLSLPERVGGSAAPAIHVVDMRRQPLREGISLPLLERIHTHLARDEQVLLFLNRRGFAPILGCHECGWTSTCCYCDARMTLHLHRPQLLCHHCGDRRPVDRACPSCGSVDLRGFGHGTERLEAALRAEFPGVNLVRIDRDSTRRRGSLETLLASIHKGGRCLLVGTQMLAKGHHFPQVTLVGIIDADQGLYGIDFRASERMAQLILQVAGRAGRTGKPGTVMIQTHHPDHPLLRILIQQGYPAFAEAALAERQAAVLPPFASHALLRAEAPEPEQALAFLRTARAWAASYAEEVELLGPAPAPMERRAGRHRAHLLVQASQRLRLHQFLNRWVEQLQMEHRGRQIRWSLDVDPLEVD